MIAIFLLKKTNFFGCFMIFSIFSEIRWNCPRIFGIVTEFPLTRRGLPIKIDYGILSQFVCVICFFERYGKKCHFRLMAFLFWPLVGMNLIDCYGGILRFHRLSILKGGVCIP